MLRSLTNSPPELIFIDTLYHFKETIELKDEVQRRYGVKVNVFRPSGVNTAAEFEALYGERLWEVNDAVYDYWAKVRTHSIAVRLFFPVSLIFLTDAIISHISLTRPLNKSSRSSPLNEPTPNCTYNPS